MSQDAKKTDDINLTSPAFFATGDPHTIWSRLRSDDPVHWTEGVLSRGFWSITRYEDAKFVLMNDQKLFSVEQFGAFLPMGTEFENPEDSPHVKLSREGAQLAMMDGQPHTALRRYFNDRFSLPSVTLLEDFIRKCSADLMADLLPKGEFDFTTELAGRLPTAVISAMMNIPREKWDDLNLWNNMLAAPEDPEFSIGTPLETSGTAVSNIISYCTSLALERRKNPGDDLLSVLAHAEIDGKPLSNNQLGYNGLMFFAAGHETTRASLSAGMLELIRHPEQMALLRSLRHDKPALRLAAEEFVRWSSPLTHTLRTAITDTVIGGQPIKKGDWVVVWYASANRDEAAFERAMQFDIARSPNNHIGFAIGKHFCLGAQLARLDMQIVIESILDTMEDIELAGDVEMAASNLFWGIKHLPIRFTRRTATSHEARAVSSAT